MKAKTKYGQARRLASTTELTREQWLDIRQLGIGSSDAAVAVGLSPYKCPLSLWLEKTGRKEPEDISHKEAVLWGIELEPVLAQVYAKRTGYRVRRVNAVLQHPEHPFMLANLDREVVGHPDGPGILEIKTASYHSAPQWAATSPGWSRRHCTKRRYTPQALITLATPSCYRPRRQHMPVWRWPTCPCA